MRKIMVPMDFSETSLNALLYAQVWKNPDDELTVVHVASKLSEINDLLLTSSNESLKNLSQELREFISKGFPANAIVNQLSLRIEVGETISVISKLSGDYDWIILGTRDKYEKIDKWFGTISFGLSKTIRSPLLLIPRNCAYKPYRKVVIASDQHLSHTPLLQAIRKWNQPYQAFLKFVHVQETLEEDFIGTSHDIVKEYYDKEEANFGFEVSVIHSIKISESLLAAAYTEDADLLIVIPDNQTFISSLLFRSISKELILKSTIPILFLQNDIKS